MRVFRGVKKWPTYRVAACCTNRKRSSFATKHFQRKFFKIRSSSAAKKVTSIICGTNKHVKNEMLSNKHTHTHRHTHTDTHTQTHRPSTVTLAAHAHRGLMRPASFPGLHTGDINVDRKVGREPSALLSADLPILPFILSPIPLPTRGGRTRFN